MTQYFLLYSMEQVKTYVIKGSTYNWWSSIYVSRDSVEIRHSQSRLKRMAGTAPIAICGHSSWSIFFYRSARAPFITRYMKEINYAWWSLAVRANLEMFDVLRIDHLGLWGILGDSLRSCKCYRGKWIKGQIWSCLRNWKSNWVSFQSLQRTLA